MDFNFAHLWQQDELSDVSIVISTQREEEGANPVVLQKLPGHTALLSTSPFFKAMILRWQHKRGRSEAECSSREVVLTLQDDEQLPAAMAVLAALYAVKPLPELLAELSDMQQLQTALLADMWQVPKVSAGAVQHMVDAANKAATNPSDDAGLSDAVVHAILDLPAFPLFVLPLLKPATASCTAADKEIKVKRVLLSVFGDLQAVWADAALQEALLDLSMPAMQLLLASDELQACEDTVLYTAQAYHDANSRLRMTSLQSFSWRQQLSKLIRCPHLSGFWLTAAALASDAYRRQMLLGDWQPQVKQLLLAQQVEPRRPLSADIIEKEVPEAPPSWVLPPHAGKQGSGSVRVQWAVNVSEIKRILQETSSEKSVKLRSPETAPLGGVSWDILLKTSWDAAAEGARLGLRVSSSNIPANMSCSFSYSLTCGDVARSSTCRVRGDMSHGWPDFFRLGCMRGGWDEAAWVAKGLPLTGELTFTMEISSVGHAVC